MTPYNKLVVQDLVEAEFWEDSAGQPWIHSAGEYLECSEPVTRYVEEEKKWGGEGKNLLNLEPI